MFRWLSDFFGPIFAKEMVETARRPRTFVLRVAYLGILLFLCFIESRNWSRTAVSQSAHVAMPKIAADIFSLVAADSWFAVWFLVPCSLMAVVAGEREGRTLDLVFTTDLVDREIILGKLMSRMFGSVVLLGGSLPLLALVGLWGGLDYGVLYRFGIALAQAVVCASSVSLYCTTISSNPLSALIRSYVRLFIWSAVFFLGPILLTEFYPNADFGMLIDVCMFCSPTTFAVAAAPEVFGAPLATFGSAASNIYLLLVAPVTISLWHLWRSIRLLRNPHRKWAIRRFWCESGRLDSARLWWTARRRQLLSRRVRTTHAPRRGYQRWTPFQDKDRVIARSQLLTWIIPLIFVLAPFLPGHGSQARHNAGVAAVMFSWMFAWTFVSLVSAGSFVSQRRRGLLDLELSSTLQPHEIYDRTLVGVLWQLRRVLLLPIVIHLFLFLSGASGLRQWILPTCLGVTFTLFLAAFGLATSLPSGRYLAPIGMTFSFFACSIFGPAFASGRMSGSSFHDVMCFLAVVSLVIAVFLARKRWTSFWVGVRLLSAWFVGWTVAILLLRIDPSQVGDWPTISSPSILTLLSVGKNSSLESLHMDQTISIAVPTAALIGTTLWSRWWCIRRFDELTGRVIQGQRPRKILRGEGKMDRGRCCVGLSTPLTPALSRGGERESES